MDRNGETKPNASGHQHARFVETAQKLGTHESEDAFKAKLGVIARQKPRQGDRTVPEQSLTEELSEAKAELHRLHQEASDDDNVRTSRDTAIRHAEQKVASLKRRLGVEP